MAKILVSAISIKQKNAISNQITGFTNAHLITGCITSLSNTTADMRTYNRTLSHATDVESARTAITTARMAQCAGGFSSTSIYAIKGFNGSNAATPLSTVVNKITASTDSQSSPTIIFATERRGPFTNCPSYLTRIYFIGGFGAAYSNLSTYIDTSTDTPTDTTDFLAPRHNGSALFTKSFAWLIAGYTTGDALTTAYYKWNFSTDTASTLGNLATATAGGCGLSYDTYGYLFGGTSRGTTTSKFRYSTETFSTGNALPSNYEFGVPSITNTTGYAWTGRRGTALTLRALYKINWSTETIVDVSYNSGDTNGGNTVQAAGV